MKEYTTQFKYDGTTHTFADLKKWLPTEIQNIPYARRILLENILRKTITGCTKPQQLDKIKKSITHNDAINEIPFYPARVLMQDFTGVPAIVDLAALRDEVKQRGKDAQIINPEIQVDLIIDHSVQVDFSGENEALTKNVNLEYHRNHERYTLLKWAQQNLTNVRVVPPNNGICHQINLEYLSSLVIPFKDAWLGADTCIGTDSHTTMVNGLGVLGFGVGGIEAEAVMLGEAYMMPFFPVVGVNLYGQLADNVTAGDLVLSLTQRLRNHGVVGKVIEYFGSGYHTLSIPDRATLANMAPEYGATGGYCPVDSKTIEFLEFTGRSANAKLAEIYFKKAALFYDSEVSGYEAIIDFDLSQVEPCLAGPSRPQDLIKLKDLKKSTSELIKASNNDSPIKNGAIAIAAITSCTNTSNPFLMIGAGLLAKNAVLRGMSTPEYVKTSFAPGSRVVLEYLKESSTLPYLKELGFDIVAFGCTTCIGNSGPLKKSITLALDQGIDVASVSSGNRNFESRIHAQTKWNFLTNPMLVIAFALKGTIHADLTTEPIALDSEGKDIYLSEIWPTQQEINEHIQSFVKPELFNKIYSSIFTGDTTWQKLTPPAGTTFVWSQDSTYIKRPDLLAESPILKQNATSTYRCLLLLGDSITTDHISPAGSIPEAYPAGIYLKQNGVSVTDFNSYGSRRGNHEVMVRGTFANIRIKNRLCPDVIGGYSKVLPDQEIDYVYNVAQAYKKLDQRTIIIAGKEYGTGSSRDWAAKGTRMLGVEVVIAESFERIHRSNLIGMGILPLCFLENESANTNNISGYEQFFFPLLKNVEPGQEIIVTSVSDNNTKSTLRLKVRLDNEWEKQCFLAGGILPYFLKKRFSNE